MSSSPLLSVVVLAWDQLHFTRRCVESVRTHTDLPYELIVVDNGSAQDAVAYAQEAADVAVLHQRNTGFAHGMNSGLGQARGRFVAFLNNDTTVPAAWASTLLSHMDDASVGAVVPVVTAAADDRIVRQAPVDRVSRFDPFGVPPPAVVLVTSTLLMQALGGWDERYEIASGEDLDLCFTLWVNELDIVLDERILVTHESKGTAEAKLDDWRALWMRNREVFLGRWGSADPAPPRLASCAPERHARNLQIARATVGWMRRYFDALHECGRAQRQLEAIARTKQPTTPATTPMADRIARRLRRSVRSRPHRDT